MHLPKVLILSWIDGVRVNTKECFLEEEAFELKTKNMLGGGANISGSRSIVSMVLIHKGTCFFKVLRKSLSLEKVEIRSESGEIAKV